MVTVVYGVVSPGEARRLESAGADVIGVFLGDEAHGRVIEEVTARAIARSLSRACLCVESRTIREIEPEAALRAGARLIQIPWGPSVPSAWRYRLAELGLSWILARVPADEDDDPAWVLGRITEYGDPAPVWAQVELCPGLEDGWATLREPSPNEIDIGDLDQIAAQTPIVVSVPLTLERLEELRTLLPHIHGVALTLAGDDGVIPGASTVDLEGALKIVRALGGS